MADIINFAAHKNWKPKMVMEPEVKPDPKPGTKAPPPTSFPPQEEEFRLVCTPCQTVGLTSAGFQVTLHTEDPSDIKEMTCMTCGRAFAPHVITADTFQDTLNKRDKMFRRKNWFWRWLNLFFIGYFLYRIIF